MSTPFLSFPLIFLFFYFNTSPPVLPQEVQDEPAEGEEDEDAGPEDPLVLAGAALDHADGVAADAEGVGDAVEAALGVLEHVALGAEVAEHGLPAGDVLVEGGVGAREEVLLAHRVRLARVVAAAHAHLAPAHDPAAAVPVRRDGGGGGRGRGGGVGVGVLGGRGREGPAAEQLGPVLVVRRVLAPRLERLQLRPELRQLGPEVARALVRLLLLRRVQLLLRQRRVLVQRAREGRQRGRERAEGRGRRGAIGRGGREGGEVREVPLDGGGLLQGRVELRILLPGGTKEKLEGGWIQCGGGGGIEARTGSGYLTIVYAYCWSELNGGGRLGMFG
ncbi:hypothetical protein SAMD00023353_2401420 [Rosellinia necatrix]|uniref:Uncharacterized protein n=1 Tax=Rosellinia necatrix TaxID=77044 RepID=A0A1S8A881_ROSNE|nr:hypothetical protein SAMD00023353_2401420 [Rosellinia necatrix]